MPSRICICQPEPLDDSPTAALHGDAAGAFSNVASMGLNGVIVLVAGTNPSTAWGEGAGAVRIGLGEQGASYYLNRRSDRWNNEAIPVDQRLAIESAIKVGELAAMIDKDCQ